MLKESFAIRVVETWNRLPDRVKLTEKPENRSPSRRCSTKIFWLRLKKNGWRNARKPER